MNSKKYTILISPYWWSIGECMLSTNLYLNYARTIKEQYPDKFYIIYNIRSRRPGSRGINPKILDYCLNLDLFKQEFIDEFYVDNVSINTQIYNNEYIRIIEDQLLVRRDEFNEELETILEKDTLPGITEYKIFNKAISPDHPLWCYMKESIEIDKAPTVTNTKQYIEFGNTIKNIAKNYLNSKNISNFETIHFRWETKLDHEDSVEIIDFWLEKIKYLINSDTTYFLSSNNSFFYDCFKKKFTDISIFFLDRGDVDSYKRTINQHPNEWEIPNIIPDGLVDSTIDHIDHVHEFLAFIELNIICNSTRIIHVNDGVRRMISMFLWYPMLVESIPVTWVKDVILTRHSTFEKFLGEVNETIKNNIPYIKIPESICKISNGYFCERP